MYRVYHARIVIGSWLYVLYNPLNNRVAIRKIRRVKSIFQSIGFR